MPRASVIRKIAKEQSAVPEVESWVVAAPVGGLNFRDALAAMPETDAIILDNLFPQPTWVELRGGKVTQATFTGICQTISAYNSLSGTNQLFAAVNNAGTGSIYRVDNTAGGPVGAPVVGGAGGTVQAITGTIYDWQQFGTGAAEVLYLVNGLDSPLLYDGTTWRAITSTSAPYAMTGGPSAGNTQLSQVIRYKSRLWFVQTGTFNVYYLPQNVFAGALTLLNLGPNFEFGGFLQAIVTNSVDNAQGINDYIAFISNQGEVVMYQGYDPASINTWSEAGHFRIGRPLATGRRTWQKIASDALVACVDGVIPLSKALVSDRSQPLIAITDKIRSGINTDTKLYGNNFGWQVVLYPSGTKIVLNVPTIPNSQGYQYVQNTISGSWCTFGRFNSPWNAICFETMADNLYFGTNGSVAQCDTGTSDDGSSFLVTAKPAFSYMNEQTLLKVFSQCQPTFQVTGNLVISITLNVDFETTAPTNTVPISSGNSAIWNVSLWSTPTFWGDALSIAQPWIGLSGVGYAASMQLRASVNGLTVKWQSTKFLFRPGGMFYGVPR